MSAEDFALYPEHMSLLDVVCFLIHTYLSHPAMARQEEKDDKVVGCPGVFASEAVARGLSLGVDAFNYFDRNMNGMISKGEVFLCLREGGTRATVRFVLHILSTLTVFRFIRQYRTVQTPTDRDDAHSFSTRIYNPKPETRETQTPTFAAATA